MISQLTFLETDPDSCRASRVLAEDGRSGDDADGSYYSSAGWFGNFLECCLDRADRPARLTLADGHGQHAVLWLRSRPVRLGPWPGTCLASLTNFYSCAYPVDGLADLRDGESVVAEWAGHTRREAGLAALHFDALDPASPGFGVLERSLRRAGFWTDAYEQFGNWYLPIDDDGFDHYWRDRPSRLRRTVDRKAKALDRAGASFELLLEPEDAERAVQAYEQAHAESWKPAEPYPLFMPGLIRRSLIDGRGRVGVLRIGGTAAAAQLWLDSGRRTTIFKLAFDERFRSLSPGSVLTKWMIRHAFQSDLVDEIDFGWGDDAYKRDWLPFRRPRFALGAYNPSRPCGLGLGVRHLAPKLARERLGWLRSRHRN